MESARAGFELFDGIEKYRGQVVALNMVRTSFGKYESPLIPSETLAYVVKDPIYDYSPRAYEKPHAFTLCLAERGEGIPMRIDRASFGKIGERAVRSLRDREVALVHKKLIEPGSNYKFADYDRCKGVDRLAREFLESRVKSSKS